MKKKKDLNLQGFEKEDFDREKMLLSRNGSFFVQEAYKTLRTNVMFSLPGAGSKCIGVTSSNRGEGKSTISINLAMSLSQLRKKVLLIDCDLRLPTVAKKLDYEPEVGLSNYLAGTEQNKSLRIYHLGSQTEAEQQTDNTNTIVPNVDVVFAGKEVPDSTALLGSPDMKKLIASLKMKYDYIVLDFPPVFIVSDAVLLSDSVDGYLIVVREGSTEYSKLNETIRQMDFASANIIGIAYNGKSVSNLVKSKSYYNYGYKYRQ